MESIISLLSDIENEANLIMNEAIDKKNTMYKDLEIKLHKIDDEYNAKLNTELDKLQHKCDSELEHELEAVQHTSDDNIHKLEETYKINHDKYLDALFEKIINQE